MAADRNDVIEALHDFLSPDDELRRAAADRIELLELRPSNSLPYIS